VQEIPDSILTHNIWSSLFQIVSKYIYKPQILLQKLDEYGPLLKQLSQNASGHNYNINASSYSACLKRKIAALRGVLT
jgi:hypothetical protein